MTVAATSITPAQCEEQVRLRRQLAHTIRTLVRAQTSHLTAREAGSPRVSILENDLKIAAAAWKQARQLYREHSALHGCGTCVFLEDELES